MAIADAGVKQSDSEETTQQVQVSEQPKQQEQQEQYKSPFPETLSEDIRNNESLKKFKDIEGFAKSYIDMEKLVGGSVKMPNEKSTPEEWNSFYNRIGRPEKPDGYQIEKPEDLPQQVEWNDDLVKSFREVAHSHGLTNAQAKGMIGVWNDIMKKAAGEFMSEERGMAALEQRFPDEPGRNARISASQRFFKEFGSDEAAEILSKTGVGNHPAVVELFAKAGKTILEDSGNPEGGEHGGGSTSVQEAKSEIARIKSDPKHPYHKGDSEATSHMAKLYELIHGKKVLYEVR